MIKFIEINFVPLMKSAFHEETLYIETRLSWHDGRGHEKANGSILRRFLRLCSDVNRAFAIPDSSGVVAVIVRARGPENSISFNSLYLFKKFLGYFLHRLAYYLAKKHQCNLAVVDRLDEATIHPNDHWILKHCDVYFKRELPRSIWSALEMIKPRRICIGTASGIPSLSVLAKKLLPLSLGIEDGLAAEINSPQPTKIYDVFYVGRAYDLERRLMIEQELKFLSNEGLRIFEPKIPLTRQGFLDAIRASTIAISPGGVGWDCFRHYEIPACATAMLIEQPSHQTYCPPQDGIEAIHYDPDLPIAPIVREWLSKPEELAKIAVAGNMWAISNHKYSSLAKHIATILSSDV